LCVAEWAAIPRSIDSLIRNYMNSIKKFFADESGVTAIEYAMIAALVAVIGLAAVKTLGTQIAALFDKAVEATR